MTVAGYLIRKDCPDCVGGRRVVWGPGIRVRLELCPCAVRIEFPEPEIGYLPAERPAGLPPAPPKP